MTGSRFVASGKVTTRTTGHRDMFCPQMAGTGAVRDAPPPLRQHRHRLTRKAACTLPALILLSPLLAVLVLLVRVNLGAPVFFRQQRPGLHGRPFMLYKFRTMTDACDEQGNLLPDAEGLTPFGHFLRSTSLDELPELWNVRCAIFLNSCCLALQ